MTMHYALDFAGVSALPKAYTAAEDAALESDILLHWFSGLARNELRFGSKWIDRKNGAVASLLSDSQRPTQTLIGQRPVVKSPAADTSPATVWVTDDPVIPDDDFSIFALVSNHGTSPAASAWSIAGNNGQTLGLRCRTSNLISVNIDAGPAISGLQSAALTNTDQPHLVEFGYQVSSNNGYVYRDGLSIIPAGPLTGWNRAGTTRRLAFASVFDAVNGTIFQGRSLGLSEVLIFRGSALGWGPPARQLVKASINEAYAGFVTVA